MYNIRCISWNKKKTEKSGEKSTSQTKVTRKAAFCPPAILYPDGFHLVLHIGLRSRSEQLDHLQWQNPISKSSPLLQPSEVKHIHQLETPDLYQGGGGRGGRPDPGTALERHGNNLLEGFKDVNPHPRPDSGLGLQNVPTPLERKFRQALMMEKSPLRKSGGRPANPQPQLSSSASVGLRVYPGEIHVWGGQNLKRRGLESPWIVLHRPCDSTLLGLFRDLWQMHQLDVLSMLSLVKKVLS